ncbi:hypothetical protein GQ56_0124605 [Burkholderia paludis]|uniref:hypothetical protein n=1 Tax=Burkholderia paludis TaxID=1506587 RepID=UPI0004DB8E8A|nr:hypothetical protein [Burkholderia paludis]KFG94721.1 hypothetical protein GQ56_0124605 [Burkholderia paludis]
MSSVTLERIEIRLVDRPAIGPHSLPVATRREGAFGTAASAHRFARVANRPGRSEPFGPLPIIEAIPTRPRENSAFEPTVPTVLAGSGPGIEPDEAKARCFTGDGLTKVAR